MACRKEVGYRIPPRFRRTGPVPLYIQAVNMPNATIKLQLWPMRCTAAKGKGAPDSTGALGLPPAFVSSSNSSNGTTATSTTLALLFSLAARAHQPRHPDSPILKPEAYAAARTR